LPSSCRKTKGDRAIKRQLEVIKTTAIGGFVFLIPAVIVVIALGKLIGGLKTLARRVSTALRQMLTGFSEFFVLAPIPGFSQKISHQEAVGVTISSSLDPQHPGFFGPVRILGCTS
jgi:hypothetical protein